MSVLVLNLVMLYVLYSVGAPIWLFAVQIAAFVGDLIHVAYKAGGENNGEDRE